MIDPSYSLPFLGTLDEKVNEGYGLIVKKCVFRV